MSDSPHLHQPKFRIGDRVSFRCQDECWEGQGKFGEIYGLAFNCKNNRWEYLVRWLGESDPNNPCSPRQDNSPMSEDDLAPLHETVLSLYHRSGTLDNNLKDLGPRSRGTPSNLDRSSSIPTPEGPGSEGYRILIVDDLQDNLLLLQTLLESNGYTVELADSGEAALTQICAAPPDLILLDVMMPDLSGYEVTRRIRENPTLPFIPILLVTVYDEANAIKGLDLGANDFIRKPIDPDELLARVRAFLRFKKKMRS